MSNWKPKQIIGHGGGEEAVARVHELERRLTGCGDTLAGNRQRIREARVHVERARAVVNRNDTLLSYHVADVRLDLRFASELLG